MKHKHPKTTVEITRPSNNTNQRKQRHKETKTKKASDTKKCQTKKATQHPLPDTKVES